MDDFERAWKELYKKTLLVRAERAELAVKYGKSLDDAQFGAPEDSSWHAEARKELTAERPGILESLPYLASL